MRGHIHTAQHHPVRDSRLGIRNNGVVLARLGTRGLIGSGRAELRVHTATLLMIMLLCTIQTYLQYYPPADCPKPIDSSHILLLTYC